MAQRQESQRQSRKSGRSLQLHPGDPVVVRNYASGLRWVPGTVQEKTGPVSFRCSLPDGREIRCHQDQVLPSKVSSQKDSTPRASLAQPPRISSPTLPGNTTQEVAMKLPKMPGSIETSAGAQSDAHSESTHFPSSTASVDSSQITRRSGVS